MLYQLSYIRETQTFFKFGFAFFAAGEAFRLADARMAPARSFEIPSLRAMWA